MDSSDAQLPGETSIPPGLPKMDGPRIDVSDGVDHPPSRDRPEAPGRAPSVPGGALIALGIGTFVAIVLLRPSENDPESQGLATFAWFILFLVPGTVLGIVDLIAGAARLRGRGWGRPLGILSAGATVLGCGIPLANLAQHLAAPEQVGMTVVLAAMTTLAAVTLTLQVTQSWFVVPAVAVVPVVGTFLVFALHELSIQPACPSISTYSGASGRLIFVGRGALCLADLNTGETDLVYSSPQRMEIEGVNIGKAWGPTISPDGQHVAFVEDGGLAIINVGGGSPRHLALEAANPAWSPDGRLIAFDAGGRTSVIDVQTGETQVVVAPSGDENADGNPSWSPDGSSLVVSRGGRLWVVGADGTGLRQLTTTGVGSQESPDWSPDGSMIAFVNVDLTAGGPSEVTIFVVRADGSGMRKLVTPPSSQSYIDPTWGPDSDHVAFVAPTDSSLGELDIVRSDGTEMRKIGTHARDPDWGS